MDLEKLKAAASAVKGWGNCSDSWVDNSEDTAACVVGMIDKETGETYPVVTVDCELYYSPDSSKLAHFYASANPAAIIELIARMEKAEKQRDELLAVFKDVIQVCKDEDSYSLAALIEADG